MIERILGEDIELVIETGAARDVIDADRGQIEQIVVNLSINARDAMPDGGVIEVVTSHEGGRFGPGSRGSGQWMWDDLDEIA